MLISKDSVLLRRWFDFLGSKGVVLLYLVKKDLGLLVNVMLL